ncbi:nitroreductase family deazaflavin-dependent oxidoreductase [Streptomyces sp. NPDC050161]|uniref:nitroreductase family deazaflavin-dependent oxidoreductase n=1 Tax=Streptomyces sp. NPDC050161 TaxID=3365604 RepID=UPI0037A29215
MVNSDSGPRRPARPTGLRRLAFRLPIHFYRAGLGGVFGQRLLCLHHIGRTSGLARQVVLEVVAHDREARTWTLASGFGPASQWYRNLRAQPHVTIQVGRRRHAVTAHFLTPDEGGEVMARYAPRHPKAAKRLSAFMGFDADGSVADYRRVGRDIPFVRLAEDPPGGIAGHGPGTPLR